MSGNLCVTTDVSGFRRNWEDAKKLQEGTLQGKDIPEEDRDYYLERRYPAFGNLVPRDVASRAAKERCDKGYGVNNTGLAVFLDFSEAINRLGKDVVAQRYGNLFDMYEEITDVSPYEKPDDDLSGYPLHNGWYLGRLRTDDFYQGPVRHR